MNKEELYEKLGGIYGGQKELIDEVVNAFEELQGKIDKIKRYNQKEVDQFDISDFCDYCCGKNNVAEINLKILNGEKLWFMEEDNDG